MIRVDLSALALPLTLGLLLTAAGGCSPDKSAVAPPPAKKDATPKGPHLATPGPDIEPRAVELLKAASARLAAARTMKFQAVVTYESPSRPGPALAYATTSEVTLHRPDKLRVITPGDGPASEFYYDGKTIMAFEPAQNVVAVADAPPTIDAALKQAFDSAAIYFPFTDVIVADPYADVADGLKLAFYIGQSNVIGGTTTDILAYASDSVFVQIWIGAEDKLPRMLRAVYHDDPSQLRHQLELSNWQLDLAVPADAFASASAAKATRIAFASPDIKLPEGLEPPGQAAPARQGKAPKSK